EKTRPIRRRKITREKIPPTPCFDSSLERAQITAAHCPGHQTRFTALSQLPRESGIARLESADTWRVSPHAELRRPESLIAFGQSKFCRARDFPSGRASFWRTHDAPPFSICSRRYARIESMLQSLFPRAVPRLRSDTPFINPNEWSS